MQLPKRKPPKYSEFSIDPVLTRAKFDELQKELERLKKKQPEAAKEVSRLAEFGDFSENVEYQLAKGRLRGINNAIFKLETQLNHAQVIDTPPKTDRIQIGHTVTIESNGKQKTYQILGSSETDPSKGIISHTSPIGSALMGRKVGEKVKVVIAKKEVEYTIVQIQ